MSKILVCGSGVLSPAQKRKFQQALHVRRMAAAGEDEVEPTRAPAIHGENKGAGRRMYGSPHQGKIDWGLRCRVYGRSDRNRKMAKRARLMGMDRLDCVE